MCSNVGYVALKNLGFNVEVYYASETNEDCINVTKANHPNEITYIGDVRKLTPDILKTFLPIDLLIGGSPCNDLSFVNPDRRGLFRKDIDNY